MLLRHWLKPPRSLFLILALLTLVSVSAVGWFGWKLLGQERLVEAQRAQDRLEQAADRIAAKLHRRLAENGDRLGDVASGVRSADVLSEGPALVLTGDSLSASPAGGLLYDPQPAAQPEAPPDVFAAGEQLEFQQRQPADAAAWYERLSVSDPAVRAGTLLRLARVLRTMGKTDDAQRVYRRLAELDAAVAGAPAELVARHAMAVMDHLLPCVLRWPTPPRLGGRRATPATGRVPA
jgi:hypothetical protein